MGELWNALIGAIDRYPEMLHQCFHATGVVCMMVGAENGARTELMFCAPGEDGVGATGVDNPCAFGCFCDVDVVIREGGDKMNGHFCISLRARYHRPIMALNWGTRR